MAVVMCSHEGRAYLGEDPVNALFVWGLVGVGRRCRVDLD